MADILGLYRRTPLLPAFTLAILGAVIIALGLTVAGVFTIEKILDHSGQSGLGAGVLVIAAVPSIIIPSFIFALTLLARLRGQVSWKTPTIAFLAGATATWIWIGPLNLTFTPMVLGTGTLAWVISCLMLHRNPVRSEATRDQT